MKKSEEALLVIDMLNDFVKEGAPLEVPDTRKIIPYLQKEITNARRAGVPVIFVCDSHDPDDKEFQIWPPHCVKSTEGAQVVEELRPQEGDIIIEKKTYSGFFNTNLEDVLKEMGVKKLKLAGCVTNICILYTASDAVLRGYDLTILKDGVAGLDQRDHQFALRQMENVLKARIA